MSDSDFGLQEEIDSSDKRDKRRRILKLVAFGMSIPCLAFTLAMIATSFHPDNSDSGDVAQSYTSPAVQDAVAKDASDPKVATPDNTSPLSPSAPSMPQQSNNTSNLQAQMNEKNKQLRKQWVGDALNLAANLGTINQLIRAGDTQSLAQAETLERKATSDAILLGILQGQPDATESQLKSSAAQLAQQSRAEYFSALLAAEAVSKGFTSDVMSHLSSASSLSSQFLQKIQQVQGYQG